MTNKTEQLLQKRNDTLEKELAAKNRELEIEAALEKVRAGTMAMQHSDDLAETSFVLFQQFKELGKTSDQISIGIFKEGENVMELYSALHGSQWKEAAKVDLSEPVVMKKIHAAWKKKKHSLVIDLEGDQLKKYNTYRKKLSNLKYKEKRWVIQVAFFSKGVLTFSSTEPHQKETIQLLERFAVVFDGTYTRFLDLQKAEAQARESQIELGLERVRARAMAMQTSNELSDLVDTVFKELTKLDFEISMCIINIIDESTLSNMVWGANPETGKPPESYYMKFENYPFHHAMMKAYKERAAKYIYVIEGDEKKIYDEYLFNETEFRKMPPEAQAASRAMKRYVASFSFSNFGGLQTVGAEPLSEANLDIFARFGKVFDLTYTRFNDLLKAEAQAREAQIEAALERVRSRTMGMQHSEELSKTASEMFKQIQALGMHPWACGFNIFDKDEKAVTQFMSLADGGISPPFRTPLTEDPFFVNIYEARQQKQELLVMESRGESLAETYRYMFGLPGSGEIFGDLENSGFEMPKFQITHCAYFSQGYLVFITYEPVPEAHDIFKRFAKVFEQTYTRFLDLQKAEAQAREAKIEAALEKIRSRSLAMQKSDELKDVIAVVFEKLKELGLVFDGAGIQLFRHGSRDSVLWVSSEISEPSLINLPYIEKANENSEFINTLWTARKTGKDIYNRTYSFDEKNKYFNYVISNNPQIPASIRELMLQSPSYTLTMIMKKNSALIADSFSGKTLSLEEYNILGRVASVFEQVYVRFLDLQKAEAQAREAQIELALERVRAKTMAMQKSEELKEVIQLVYEQFVHLNIYIEHTGFLMDYKERDDLHIWLADRHLVPSEVTIPWFDSLPNNSIKEAKEKGQDFFKYLLDFEEKNKFYQDLFMFIPGVPEETLKYYLNCPGLAGSGVLLENIGLYIENFSGTPYTDEENDTLMRLGKVFQQTYTRFLDLEKAEAQARESQIQLALERVRARTMAMQKSDELSETVYVLFQQFNELGEKPDQATIGVINEDEKVIEYWVTMYGKPINKVFKFSIDEPNVTNKIYQAWKENKKSLIIDLSGDALTEFMAYRAAKDGAAINPDEKRRVINVAFFSKGLLNVQSNEERSEESIKLLERFASVFEQTYTRFLDLQKAEAQAREAQIELGLERVRARAMAMQTSEELNALIGIVFTELTKLDLVLTRCVIIIYDAETKGAQWWMANSEAPSAPMNFFVKYANLPFFNMYLKGWEERDLKWQYILEGENKIITDNFLFNETELKTLPDFVIEGMKVPHKVYLNASFNNFGNLTLATLEPLSEKHFDILLRFAKVFDLTYTRFNDLQKAEAQTREAEIQLALERVRARTMAMQKQDDLLGVLDLLVEQLVKLGVNLQVANFSNGIPGGDWNLWIEVVADANNIFNNYVHFPRIDHPYFHHVEKNIENFRKDGTDLFKDVFSKEEKDSWQDYIDTQTIYKDLTSEEIRQSMYEKPGYTWSMIILKDTWVSICRYDTIPFSVEDDALLRRFANAFGQTYTRFLDLQKAEAQAREAQIEAALERVRSRSMAMFKSEELSDVITVVADQLQQLDVRFEHVSFVINSDAEDYHFWTALYGKPHPYELKVPYLDNPIANRVKKARSQGIKFFQDTLTPEENRLWLEHAFSNNPVDFFTPEEKAYAISRGFSRSIALMPNIMLAVGNYASKPYSDDNNDIIKRFASVFEQSYTRFLDLKKSEAQAREAQIEAALERVRSCTLAMQKSDELANTSAVLFQQLIHLGIAPNRLYIGITNDKNTEIEFWITDEDGSKVSTMFSGDAAKNISIKKMYDGWKQEKKSIVIDMRDKELDDYFHYLGDELLVPFQGGLEQKRRIQYISYFSKGFIGMASPDEQPEETMLLLQRFAAVFNLTFTRFNDLKVAEAHALQAEHDLIEIKAARKKAEETLVELQSTQKQLIQSEKMASLGELTAGIAHEIQNPLNFVNNFSEINKEILEELKAERLKQKAERDDTLQDELINDVIDNSEKINHHGKRAGDIVKGMLQHSRTSTGVKEPTDINALADEYLRLSYHGLRAKDKSFNAKMETDFDENIGKINIIPQDIGRVLLNLYNNAFYACAERSRSTVNEQKSGNSILYEPTVSVTTKKSDNHVIITVSDNGSGVPKNIVDKIFQPFFTTKPTGQGTGLGLSLSYDIIKAHGGEIKVKSMSAEAAAQAGMEEDGTTFIILLPC